MLFKIGLPLSRLNLKTEVTDKATAQNHYAVILNVSCRLFQAESMRKSKELKVEEKIWKRNEYENLIN